MASPTESFRKKIEKRIKEIIEQRPMTTPRSDEPGFSADIRETRFHRELWLIVDDVGIKIYVATGRYESRHTGIVDQDQYYIVVCDAESNPPLAGSTWIAVHEPHGDAPVIARAIILEALTAIIHEALTDSSSE
jgi:hypothetical protein